MNGLRPAGALLVSLVLLVAVCGFGRPCAAAEGADPCCCGMPAGHGDATPGACPQQARDERPAPPPAQGAPDTLPQVTALVVAGAVEPPALPQVAAADIDSLHPALSGAPPLYLSHCSFLR